MRAKKAIYAGSFDPLTLGHIWIIRRAADLFDHLTIAIGENADKKYLFSLKKRKAHIEQTLKELKLTKKVRVVVITNKFLVKFAEENKVPYLIRGLRGSNDFEYEFVMNQVNREMVPEVDTIYLIPPRDLASISSSLVKGLVGPEGWEKAIKKYVPPHVISDLKKI
jgi:pantetheine-phosphate adenylyltransferase